MWPASIFVQVDFSITRCSTAPDQACGAASCIAILQRLIGIQWLNSFSNETCGITRAPFGIAFPLEIENTVTFADRDGGTVVSLRAEPHGATDGGTGRVRRHVRVARAGLRRHAGSARGVSGENLILMAAPVVPAETAGSRGRADGYPGDECNALITGKDRHHVKIRSLSFH